MADDAKTLVKSFSKKGDVEIMVSAEHLILSCFCGKTLTPYMKSRENSCLYHAYTSPKNEASGIMQKQVDRVFHNFSDISSLFLSPTPTK